MEIEERERFINQIASGVLLYKSYIIKRNTCEQKYIADVLYKEALEDVKYEDWADTNMLNIVCGTWFKSDEAKYTELLGKIDAYKIKLYQQFHTSHAKFFRNALKIVRAELQELDIKKNTFFYLTRENYALTIKNQYLIAMRVFRLNGQPVWNLTNFQEKESLLLQEIIAFSRLHYISTSQLRELARSEPWRSYWWIDKNVFGKSPIKLSDTQKLLIVFSKMYDSAYENTDRPPEEIINDDDAFDGWMLLARQNQDKEKQNKSLDSHIDRVHKGAKEIFLAADFEQPDKPATKEDIERIKALNDDRGQFIKQQRFQMIDEKGTVKIQEFADVRIEIEKTAEEKHRHGR